MERIWLKQYPAGVPADIDVTQYSSLVELLEESFKKFADRKAFICMDKSISYRELDEMSAAFGAYLQSKGLQKGARVALMMPNVLQYPVATAAVLRAGYAVVNVNPAALSVLAARLSRAALLVAPACFYTCCTARSPDRRVLRESKASGCMLFHDSPVDSPEMSL